VPVIEYYAPSLDHYFITSIPLEIAALDNQTIPGWQRTGQSFNAYATGSDGPVGRVPVCRDYGSPAAGLDSHFYTASALECLDVITKFVGAWLLESGEVFQINLPDIFTGICPAGTVPVYRLWNQRVDSNHRYTTSLVTRNQMLAKGYASEGYGPNGVVLCAQP
jgi:serine protease